MLLPSLCSKYLCCCLPCVLSIYVAAFPVFYVSMLLPSLCSMYLCCCLPCVLCIYVAAFPVCIYVAAFPVFYVSMLLPSLCSMYLCCCLPCVLCRYAYSVEFASVLFSAYCHDSSVTSLCWRADILATGSWDSTVKVWCWIVLVPPRPIPYINLW